jgi:hypothetical protein
VVARNETKGNGGDRGAKYVADHCHQAIDDEHGPEKRSAKDDHSAERQRRERDHDGSPFALRRVKGSASRRLGQATYCRDPTDLGLAPML